MVVAARASGIHRCRFNTGKVHHHQLHRSLGGGGGGLGEEGLRGKGGRKEMCING
jgi:hypothetical protein